MQSSGEDLVPTAACSWEAEESGSSRLHEKTAGGSEPNDEDQNAVADSYHTRHRLIFNTTALR